MSTDLRMITIYDTAHDHAPCAAVQFCGSSSHAAAIQTWIADGRYTCPTVLTRDLRTFGTPDGTVVGPGDWIVHAAHLPCAYTVFGPKSFSKRFTTSPGT